MRSYKLLVLLVLVILVGCKPENNTKYEERKLFAEMVNLPSEVEQCIRSHYTGRVDTVYNYGRGDKEKEYIVYKFFDADSLPKTHLLDGTRKIRLLLLNEKDLVGNPLYSQHLYLSEKSNWKRVRNFGDTPFCGSDTLVSNKYICEILSNRLNIQYWKALP